MPIRYRSAPETNYQILMRNWYGTEMNMVTGNCFRKTVRDFPIFEEMEQGDDYVRASEIADSLFDKACKVRGITQISNPNEYAKLKKAIVPPYDRGNFTSKWQKLNLDKPSHTLVAHLWWIRIVIYIHMNQEVFLYVRQQDCNLFRTDLCFSVIWEMHLNKLVMQFLLYLQKESQSSCIMLSARRKHNEIGRRNQRVTCQ